MLIRVVSLGCNWWGRPGGDPEDPHRYTSSAAYFNSTGVRCGNKIRRHWVLEGLIRFNGVGNFSPQRPLTCIGRTFSCSDVTNWAGGNRVLFINSVKDKAPDLYLVTFSSDENGIIDCSVSGWKSEKVRTIAISQLRDQQQAMFLMNPGDWVKTNCGTWTLDRAAESFSSPLPQLLLS